MGEINTTTETTPQPRYEPLPVDLRKRTWLNALDTRVRRHLPKPAYRSMLAGYHGLRRLAGRNPGRGRVLPDFVILGAAKAGTTSLYAWLCEHPDVRRARVKEVHYFSFYYYRGNDWYRHHFPPSSERPFVTGEASPSYLMDENAPERMARLIPDAKLIVSLREPVDRAYSQFHMRRAENQERIESFLTACALEDPEIDGGVALAQTDPEIAAIGRTYLLRGRYAEQLERWFEYFPREQVHVLAMHELAEDPQGALDRVHEFLGLAPRRAGSLEVKFKQSYEPMPADARERLTDYFRPHNQRLYELLGSDLGWAR